MQAPERLNARNELIGFSTKLQHAAEAVTDDSRLKDIDGTLTEVSDGIKSWRETYLEDKTPLVGAGVRTGKETPARADRR